MAMGNNHRNGTADYIREQKPGGQSSSQPDNKGDIIRRFDLESHAEDKPEYGYHDNGLDNHPERPETGTDILTDNLASGHQQDETALLPDRLKECGHTRKDHSE